MAASHLEDTARVETDVSLSEPSILGMEVYDSPKSLLVCLYNPLEHNENYWEIWACLEFLAMPEYDNMEKKIWEILIRV